jgi:glycosyltransferase involved in cell wall biosynthesis
MRATGIQKDPLVSIIVPVYNSESYLVRCIESILNQSYTNIEVILVNDGSKDKSGDVCNYYESLDHRAVALHIENSGVSNARNVGLNKAVGQYIGFCDADDFFEPTMIEELLEQLIHTKSDIAICGYTNVYESGKKLESLLGKDNTFNSEKLISFMISDDNIGGFVWNKLFSSIMVKNVSFNEKLEICEDVNFIFDVSAFNDFRGCYINRPLYNYYQNSLSATRNLNNLFISDQRFKFSDAYNLLMLKTEDSRLIVDRDIQNTIRSKIFVCSLSTYLQNVISKELNKSKRNLLRKNMKENYKSFIKDKYIKKEYKLQLMLFYSFPFLKYFTNK